MLFPEPIMANSVMDRIAHNAHQIIMTGESYRTKGKITLKRMFQNFKQQLYSLTILISIGYDDWLIFSWWLQLHFDKVGPLAKRRKQP
ncbi:MAG: hypothetical protein AB1467_07540 [Candidatus Diapherotrites archaeon]